MQGPAQTGSSCAGSLKIVFAAVANLAARFGRRPIYFQAAAAQGGFGVETETCQQLLSLQDMSP